MTIQWRPRVGREDLELAVALNACADLLLRAQTNAQMDEAVRANLRLWRTIRERCMQHPLDYDADELMDSADHVAALLAAEYQSTPHPRDIAFVAGRNLALAGDFGADADVQGRFAHLMRQWSESGDRARFENWLLHRVALAA